MLIMQSTQLNHVSINLIIISFTTTNTGSKLGIFLNFFFIFMNMVFKLSLAFDTNINICDEWTRLLTSHKLKVLCILIFQDAV